MVDARTRVITTVAGTAQYGYTGDGGPATAARIGYANGIALDSANNLYISDFTANVVRMVTGVPPLTPMPTPPVTASLTLGASPSKTESTSRSSSMSPSASRSAAPTPSVTATLMPPPVAPLVVDGAAARGSVVAGQALFFAYAQSLPYGVTLTLESLDGDADLVVGPAPPVLGGGFNYSASSTNGGSVVDAVTCESTGPAISASGGTGAQSGAATSACWGPAATSTWFVQVAGWTAATFSLDAKSNMGDPLGVGSPQPSPGAVGATLALGVTAAGTLSAAAEVVYWALTPPPSAGMIRLGGLRGAPQRRWRVLHRCAARLACHLRVGNLFSIESTCPARWMAIHSRRERTGSVLY